MAENQLEREWRAMVVDELRGLAAEQNAMQTELQEVRLELAAFDCETQKARIDSLEKLKARLAMIAGGVGGGTAGVAEILKRLAGG